MENFFHVRVKMTYFFYDFICKIVFHWQLFGPKCVAHSLSLMYNKYNSLLRTDYSCLMSSNSITSYNLIIFI